MNQAIAKYRNEHLRTDAKDRDTMIRDYLPLVRRVAHGIARGLPAHLDVNDLISAGSIGLIAAIERYNPDRGTSFSTFAAFRIRGAIIDELRSLDPLPRRVRQKYQKLEQTRKHLTNQFGRPPIEEEVAEELGLSLAELQKITGKVTPAFEMSLSLLDNLETPFHEGSPQHLAPPDRMLQHQELRRSLVQAIRKLPKQMRMLISLYYYSKLNYKEIALLFNVSESRICQIHRKAVGQMRQFLQQADCENRSPEIANKRNGATTLSTNAVACLQGAP